MSTKAQLRMGAPFTSGSAPCAVGMWIRRFARTAAVCYNVGMKILKQADFSWTRNLTCKGDYGNPGCASELQVDLSDVFTVERDAGDQRESYKVEKPAFRCCVCKAVTLIDEKEIPPFLKKNLKRESQAASANDSPFSSHR